MAWIDYQKAFDRVPHSWIIKSLELIGINNIKIQCGIFQGDSLSPLLFCICLIPLTEQLNRLNTGFEEYTTKTKISHLLHMDYLKLISK